eukprot:987676-Pelagomonas_calceolata.AAC.1
MGKRDRHCKLKLRFFTLPSSQIGHAAAHSCHHPRVNMSKSRQLRQLSNTQHPQGMLMSGSMSFAHHKF